jgi:1-acyl-sn-glycerol-3-phosphate acyltransferase
MASLGNEGVPTLESMAAEPHLVSSSSVSDVAERRDTYYWRLAATALCFALFGVGALVVGGILVPIVRIFPASPATKRARTRLVIGASLRFFVVAGRFLAVWSCQFQGLERLGRPGQLILANHPSLLDAVCLLAVVRGANCIMKEELWRNPLTRRAVILSEYITNESTAAMIEGGAKALHDGETVIVFPEGTRTKPQQRCVFHRGAANLALRAARVVTPVYIRVEPTTLTKGEAWYRIPARRFHISLIVGEDIDLEAHRRRGPIPLASRTLNEYLQSHFDHELSRQRGNAGSG